MTADNRTSDHWFAWWTRDRLGGNDEAAQRGLAALAPVRERLLDQARLRAGDTVLDIGTGTGLVGLGALERLAGEGHVIFSDISPGLVADCARKCEQRGVHSSCSFVVADAQELDGIASASVDVVTARSVLCYVASPARAFEAIRRVLRPGGRLSLFETMHVRQPALNAPTIFGFLAPELDDCATAIDRWLRESAPVHDQLTARRGFDEIDLLMWADKCGLTDAAVSTNTQFNTTPAALTDWSAFLASRPRPLGPTIREALSGALQPPDQERVEQAIRPQIEQGQIPSRIQSYAYLAAERTAA